MQCLIIKTFTYIQYYTYKKRRVTNKMSDKTTLTIRIERDLLKDMKIIAIQQDTSVTRIIIDYLEQYVEEHKK